MNYTVKYFYDKNNLFSKLYLLNDKLHREDGPAIIYYDKNDIEIVEYYFLNDIELTKTQWLIHCRKRKLKSIL